MDTISIENLKQFAGEFGLVSRGGFKVKNGDGVPDIEDKKAKYLLLFGNAGSSIWENFSLSSEYQASKYQDEKEDPLDRWSERIGKQMAREFSGLALFPFGKPLHPFLQWAKRSESLNSSKLGMIIHPQYGLWHAYRFAIAFPVDIAGSVDIVEPAHVHAHALIENDICARCEDQPCLKTCPVDAFSEGNYAVKDCYKFLAKKGQESCMKGGCQARLACPEGVNFRYKADHGKFHMDAFYLNISRRFDES